MKLQRGLNLFRALRDVCDFIPLESDMDEIVKAVEDDNATIDYGECEKCGLPNHALGNAQCHGNECINK